MKKLFKKLFARFSREKHATKKQRKAWKTTEYKIMYLEVSAPLSEGFIQIYEDDDFLEMLCPCGCGGKETLFLAKEVDVLRGYWQLEKHEDGTISIHNSIGSALKCKSHYFIRHNKVSEAFYSKK